MVLEIGVDTGGVWEVGRQVGGNIDKKKGGGEGMHCWSGEA